MDDGRSTIDDRRSIPSRRTEDLRHVDRFRKDDRTDRVVEVQVIVADEAHDRAGEIGRGQRPGRDNHRGFLRRARNRRHLLAPQRDPRMTLDSLGDGARKQLAIDRQRRAGRHPRDIGGVHDQRVEPPHLLFEETDGVVELVAAERVAADQLGEPVGFVDVSRPNRPHFMDRDRNTARCRLPGGLAPGQAAANDSDWTDSQIPNPYSLIPHP